MRQLTAAARAWFSRPRDESSNSFALFFVMLPLIIGAFGLGLDVSRNVYIRTTLQNALDMATVAGAGVTQINDRGHVYIDDRAAIDTVERVYAINRAGGPPVDCWGDRSTIPGTNQRRCWKLVDRPVVNNEFLRYRIRERTRNAFLPVVGIEWQRYTIESKARVTQDAE